MFVLKPEDIINIGLINNIELQDLPEWLKAYKDDYWVLTATENAFAIAPSNPFRDIIYQIDNENALLRIILTTRNKNVLSNLKLYDAVMFNNLVFYKISDDKLFLFDWVNKTIDNSELFYPVELNKIAIELTDWYLRWDNKPTEYKYRLTDVDTNEIFENHESKTLLEIIYDKLESGESSKLILTNNETGKSKVFTLNDLEQL